MKIVKPFTAKDWLLIEAEAGALADSLHNEGYRVDRSSFRAGYAAGLRTNISQLRLQAQIAGEKERKQK